ncbi:hypothetical protein IQE94_14580 [Synechocystis sp. PCC 7339]|uniref:hypothetical protein n=1 Tax=unclassified Synechocystis TaxID=2640012 RepID=UPI001BAED343|nr:MULTISPECIES: hypothetical protein [unclassified Synechocystis]QUS60266.1 hypothetical protein HTZ78_05970 [Synechocystis sp. PCC 7338]UAJ72288.1 hypothetical protein IQE94_14580 [Synechocystis sp. PCC 7339]
MDQIEQKVKELYDLAKIYPDDENLQIAVSSLKSIRRSRGSLQSWNSRYRSQISDLNNSIEIQEEEKNRLQAELDQIKLEVKNSVVEKQRMIIERDKIKADLKNIQTEVELAALKVKESKSWFGKFHILWTFVNSVFFDEPPDMGLIDTSPKSDPDKPQMDTKPSSIGRDPG